MRSLSVTSSGTLIVAFQLRLSLSMETPLIVLPSCSALSKSASVTFLVPAMNVTSFIVGGGVTSATTTISGVPRSILVGASIPMV